MYTYYHTMPYIYQATGPTYHVWLANRVRQGLRAPLKNTLNSKEVVFQLVIYNRNENESQRACGSATKFNTHV